MKNLFFVSVAFCIFSGTSFSAQAQKAINPASYNEGRSPKFIDGIEIKADVSNTQVVETAPVIKTTQSEQVSPGLQVSTEIEHSSSLQFKYAQLLNRNVEEINNISLYNFIDEWWGTRYRYGGKDKKGIDCSALTGLLMSSVFAIKLPRTAREQYSASVKIEKEEMNEGDLVFFNTTGGVSHVGVYLGNNYFVHASRNSGVIISNLLDPYYENRFISGGRVSEQANNVAGTFH